MAVGSGGSVGRSVGSTAFSGVAVFFGLGVGVCLGVFVAGAVASGVCVDVSIFLPSAGLFGDGVVDASGAKVAFFSGEVTSASVGVSTSAGGAAKAAVAVGWLDALFESSLFDLAAASGAESTLVVIAVEAFTSFVFVSAEFASEFVAAELVVCVAAAAITGSVVGSVGALAVWCG